MAYALNLVLRLMSVAWILFCFTHFHFSRLRSFICLLLRRAGDDKHNREHFTVSQCDGLEFLLPSQCCLAVCLLACSSSHTLAILLELPSSLWTIPDFELVDHYFWAIGHSGPCNRLLNFQAVTKLLLELATADSSIDFGKNCVVEISWRVMHDYERNIY